MLYFDYRVHVSCLKIITFSPLRWTSLAGRLNTSFGNMVPGNIGASAVSHKCIRLMQPKDHRS